MAAFLYAFHLIDSTGLTAIVAAAGTYQVGEGLADIGKGRVKPVPVVVPVEAE